MNLTRIVVATDFSDNSLPALETALSLAQETGAELHIVHVVEVTGVAAGEILPVADALEALHRGARRQLSSLVPSNYPSDLTVQTVSLAGKPASEIALYAKAAKADMIVLGTHGRKGLSRMLLGSTAEQLLREAPCQVLVVKPHDSED